MRVIRKIFKLFLISAFISYYFYQNFKKSEALALKITNIYDRTIFALKSIYNTISFNSERR